MRDVMPAPSLEVTGPGVYPLETRECPGCGDRRHSKYRCRRNADCDRRDGHLGPHRPCKDCHSAGRVPDENAAKVIIAGFASSPRGMLNSFYWWPQEGTFGKNRSGPFPTPAEAFAAAQRAHEKGKR